MGQIHVDPASFFGKCSHINFGRIVPAGEELEFYNGLNEAMIVFLKSLPVSMQSEAMLFCTRYAGIRIGDPLDFFRNYHAPVWSVIYWAAAGRLVSEQLHDCVTAHAMAMLLHSLDDHLADGEMPITHLSLLIRSQAWLVMQQALVRLGSVVPGGLEAVRDLIDEYYSGISNTALPYTLGDYCARFRKQMATGLIVPHLVSLIADIRPGYADLVCSASKAFGVAWRLLDDIQDIGDDILRGRRTAVYCCLPMEGKALWESFCSDTGICTRENGVNNIIELMRKTGTISSIVSIILEDLNRAADFARKAGLGGLAEEYRILMNPLEAWMPE